MSWRTASGTAAILASLVLATVSAFGGTVDVNTLSGDALVAAAKEEGGLTVYCGPINTNALIAETFEKEFGIPVQFLRLPSAAIMQRYSAEAASGSVVADVLWCAGMSRTFVEEGLSKDWLEPIEAAKLTTLMEWTLPERFEIRYGDTLVSAINLLQAWGFSYNTRMIEESALPKTIEGLADPAYKGEINLVDPRSAGSYQQLWGYLLKTRGEDWVRAIGENRGQLSDSNNTSAQSVAAGEQPIGFPSALTAPARIAAQGAPISWVQPEDTLFFETRLLLTAPDKAPHPAAARLFADWILSREGTALASSNPADGLISVYDEKAPATFEVQPDPSPEVRDKIADLLGLE